MVPALQSSSVVCRPAVEPSEMERERQELWIQAEALTASAFQASADRLRRKGAIHLKLQARTWAQWEREQHGRDPMLDEDDRQEEKPPKPQAETVEIDGEEVRISRWHASRARGRARKFEVMRHCNEAPDFLRIECRVCGAEHHHPIGCNHRECPRCRFDQASRVKRVVTNGRRALRAATIAKKRDRTIREKLLTLTAPHYGAGWVREAKATNADTIKLGATRRRIEAIHSAWVTFGPWLRDYMLSKLPQTKKGKPQKGLVPLCHFFRVFEWTEGEDEQGHPHFHIYIHGPFLSHVAIREAWERALEIATGEASAGVIVDIRKVTDGGNVRDAQGKKHNVVDELVKYMVKDLSTANRGRFIDPVSLAAILVQMEGRRRRQTSAGFGEWAEMVRERIEEKECHECETTGGLEARHIPHAVEKFPCGRGPPNNRPAYTVQIVAPALLTLRQLAFQI